MKFKLDGRSYEFDETRLLVREARELKHHTGMGLRQFGAGLQEGDPDSIVGMLYLCRRRAGEAVKWNDFDELNLTDLQVIPDEEPEAVPADPATNGHAVHTDPPVVVDTAEVTTPA
jgi:hypothetical protein